MKCPACQRKSLDHARDRVTKKIVKEDGRFLLRCSACSETLIVDKKKLKTLKGLAERPSILWWIAAGLGVAGTLTEYLLGWAMRDGPELSIWAVYALVAFMTVGMLRILVWYVMAIAEAAPGKEKFECWIGFLFMLAFAVFMVWLGVNIWRDERDRLRRSGPPPISAARAPHTGDTIVFLGSARHSLRGVPTGLTIRP